MGISTLWCVLLGNRTAAPLPYSAHHTPLSNVRCDVPPLPRTPSSPRPSSAPPSRPWCRRVRSATGRCLVNLGALTTTALCSTILGRTRYFTIWPTVSLEEPLCWYWYYNNFIELWYLTMCTIIWRTVLLHPPYPSHSPALPAQTPSRPRHLRHHRHHPCGRRLRLQ